MIRHYDLGPTVSLLRFLQETQGSLAIPGLGDDALQHLSLVSTARQR